jgi:hypothetical protein
MTNTKQKITDQIRTALATYTGPIKKCPPGKASGKIVKSRRDAAERWLSAHGKDVLIKNEKAERRRLRLARAQRERIANRNAAIRKLIGETS